MSQNSDWVTDVERSVERFARKYSLTYSRSEREISASFEIGCFHALVNFYSERCKIEPKNLRDGKYYRYLTSPNGNPNNFSYVRARVDGRGYEIRQQVRIRSHLADDIAFTPDLVVLPEDVDISSTKDKDYAKGKRSFFCVSSEDVIAAHECKSMMPFPELLVSFIGTLTVAHAWLDDPKPKGFFGKVGLHLAPSLFVGGTPRGLHVRMIRALEKCYPINVIVGLHSGTWDLTRPTRTLNVLPPGEKLYAWE